MKVPTKKAENLAKAAVNYSLTAYASEDEAQTRSDSSTALVPTGTTDYDIDSLNVLMEQRNATVNVALANSKHSGERKLQCAHRDQLIGRSDYRKMRTVSVEVVGTERAEPATLEVKDPGELAAITRSFGEAQAKAIKQVHRAQVEFTLGYGKHKAHVETYFGKNVFVMRLIEKLSDLEAHIKDMSLPGRHEFVSRLDPRAEGSPAKNSGVGAKSKITIRPRFGEDSMAERVDTLIHEGTHGTSSIDSEDYAYMDQRLFDFLADKDKAANADSFVLFIRAILGQDVQDVRHTANDSYTGFDACPIEKLVAAKRTVALSEHALATTAQDLARLYQRAAKAFKETKGFADDHYFGLASKLAGILAIDQPALDRSPNLNSLVQLSGLAHKFNSMKRFIAGDMTVCQVATNFAKNQAEVDEKTDRQLNVDLRFIDGSAKEQMRWTLLAIFHSHSMRDDNYLTVVRVCTEGARFSTPLSDYD